MHLREIAEQLERLRQDDRLRTPDDRLEAARLRRQFGTAFIDAASNDYLGLARLRLTEHRVREEHSLVSRETGPGGVRLSPAENLEPPSTQPEGEGGGAGRSSSPSGAEEAQPSPFLRARDRRRALSDPSTPREWPLPWAGRTRNPTPTGGTPQLGKPDAVDPVAPSFRPGARFSVGESTSGPRAVLAGEVVDQPREAQSEFVDREAPTVAPVEAPSSSDPGPPGARPTSDPRELGGGPESGSTVSRETSEQVFQQTPPRRRGVVGAELSFSSEEALTPRARAFTDRAQGDQIQTDRAQTDQTQTDRPGEDWGESNSGQVEPGVEAESVPAELGADTEREDPAWSTHPSEPDQLVHGSVELPGDFERVPPRDVGVDPLLSSFDAGPVPPGPVPPGPVPPGTVPPVTVTRPSPLSPAQGAEREMDTATQRVGAAPGGEPNEPGKTQQAPSVPGLELTMSPPAPPMTFLGEPVSRETIEQAQAGAAASRLIYGTHAEHLEAEALVARWLGFERALLFSSGYAANVGALGALLSAEDAVFSDALNHASLIDGIRLSKARPRVFPHLDWDTLERGLQGARGARARWVIVESYYSMDGDGPDLKRLRALCDRQDAHLYVDEAHSVGTFGPEGRGLCARAGIRPDVLMAGFGKAIGCQGACILGSVELRTWLWNRARSFVFSTAPAPWSAHALQIQVERARRAEPERARLMEVTHRLRRSLAAVGVPLVAGSFGPVVSLLVGSEKAALGVADSLRREGVLAQAVRPPTVPAGESRIRLVLRSSLEPTQERRLLEVVARVTREHGLLADAH